MGVTELPPQDDRLRQELRARDRVFCHVLELDQSKPGLDQEAVEAILEPFRHLDFFGPSSKPLKDRYDEALEQLTQLLEKHYGMDYPLPRDRWSPVAIQSTER
jgi:hypothetical protein